ncbi:hypothetical protein [Devosia sp.]|uniref:hypothetical protein n=1 Tax=Devosia sp. TaxID=1871048 RepID=UPI0027373557|nr:hypothetical protein [Devosia sp.]MDP2780932.1 hypothetical protein [Devosia sp.]
MNKLKENRSKGKVTSIGVDLAKNFTQLNGDVVDDSVSLQKSCPSYNSLGLARSRDRTE